MNRSTVESLSMSEVSNSYASVLAPIESTTANRSPLQQDASPPSNASPGQSLGIIDRTARRIVVRQLRDLTRGEITLRDASGACRVGQADDLHVVMQIHKPRFYRDAILGGTLSVAESYLQGDWDCDDLAGLFRIFTRNCESADRFDKGFARLTGMVHRWFHYWHANSRSGSRNNIHAHYDLGNEFFRLWLDDTMAYSSAIFTGQDDSLQQASSEKFDRVCRRLQLKSSDHVLEIGSGWGGFAMHAASQYGCRVTTTTISQEQYDEARQRIREAGLSHRISVLLSDYRDLKGQFDKLVSIEMIEAVGHKYMDEYFRCCSQLLKPTGSMMLQAILMPERRHEQYLKSVDFIQRYVFPGGCLPSMGSILDSVARATDLRLVNAEDFAPHYAETLRRWCAAFHERIDDVRQLGYSERFLRLWHYYLCYCEAVFEERYCGVMQIQFDKPRCRRDAIPASSTGRETMFADRM